MSAVRIALCTAPPLRPTPHPTRRPSPPPPPQPALPSELLPATGALVFDTPAAALAEVLCKPKLMPIKSAELLKVESIAAAAAGAAAAARGGAR